MRTVVCLIIVIGSCTASAAARTGNELMLLRMTLRQEMAAQVQAAAGSTDATVRNQIAPLETALLGLPRVQDLYAVMTDNRQNVLTKFNAARALAYFGDLRSAEFLSAVFQGQFRSFAKGAEKSQAALCLLYLGHDFPDDFAFSTLAPPLYPELDALLEEPSEPLSPLSPYTQEQLATAVASYLESDYPVTVRGPLSVLTVEQEALEAVLDNVAEQNPRYMMRVPFANRVYEWEEFKDEMLAGDLFYYFRLDEAAWEAQEGYEGYALIREGQTFAAFLTATSQSQDPELLAFDDFDGHLGLGWNILNPDPSCWSLSKVPDTLTITTQTGTFARNRQDYRNVFLLNCPTAPGQDFQITTCLESFVPLAPWNQAGLLLWNSPDHYLKLDYEYNHVYLQGMYTLGLEVAGNFSFTWYIAEQYPQRVWLRIVKRGTFCELYASVDGEVFMPLRPESGSGAHRALWGDAEVLRVGLFADNGSATDAPSVDASFDFFEVKALAPEDERRAVD